MLSPMRFYRIAQIIVCYKSSLIVLLFHQECRQARNCVSRSIHLFAPSSREVISPKVGNQLDVKSEDVLHNYFFSWESIAPSSGTPVQ
jgi:hypothetical protein